MEKLKINCYACHKPFTLEVEGGPSRKAEGQLFRPQPEHETYSLRCGCLFFWQNYPRRDWAVAMAMARSEGRRFPNDLMECRRIAAEKPQDWKGE